jgi:DNA-binding response OmpR family regulator
MLDGAPILIVEDEPFIAMDLADAVRAAGGSEIGPVSTVREGLALLRDAPVAGAILDCHLRDRDVSPLAQALLEIGTPLVVYTASELAEALAQWRTEIPMIRKPEHPADVVARLVVLIGY